MNTINILNKLWLALLLMLPALHSGCQRDAQTAASLQPQGNDGYSSALMKGKEWSDFDVDRVALYPADSFPGIEIMEINAKQLMELAQERDSLWVVCWATWCNICVGDIPHNLELVQRNPGLKLIFAATNYDVDGIKRLLGRNGYSGTAFIISSKDYEGDQLEKVNKFGREVAGKLAEPVEGVPVNIMLLNGRAVSWKGSSMTPEAIGAIFPK